MTRIEGHGFSSSASQAKEKARNVERSIATVVKEFHGRDVRAKTALSEEGAVCVSAYRGVSRLGEALGKDFLRAVKSEWRRLRNDKVDKPLFQAIDRELKKLSEAGKITVERGESILRNALGRGNLRGTISQLFSGRVNVAKDTRKVTLKSNLALTAEKMCSNRRATAEELETIRNRIYKKNSMIGPVPTSRTGGDEIQSAPLPSSKDIHTSPSDMAWYPESTESGNGVFMIPEAYSGEVDRVSVYDAKDDLLEELDGRFVGSDGRRHFRSSKTGAALGSNLSFVLHFTDGTYMIREAAEGGSFRKWGFSI